MVSFAVTTFCIASYQVFIVMLIETYDFLMADLEEGGGGKHSFSIEMCFRTGKTASEMHGFQQQCHVKNVDFGVIFSRFRHE